MFEAHGYPFSQDDYDTYVDGKPREDGIRDFLASRDVHPSEARDQAARRREERPRPEADREQGVDAYEGSRRYLRPPRTRACDAPSSRAATTRREVLEVTGLGRASSRSASTATSRAELGLKGKPAPDTFLEGRAKARASSPTRPPSSRTRWPASQAGRAGQLRLRRRRQPRRTSATPSSSTAPTSSSTTSQELL